MIKRITQWCKNFIAKPKLVRVPVQSDIACTKSPTQPGQHHNQHRRSRRGFSMIEVMIALAITASLMSAVMVALDASFRAYRATTESASRHTVARLTMHRILALIRTGSDFGPFQANVITTPIIKSDTLEFTDRVGNILRIEYRVANETFYVIQDPGGDNETESILLAGAVPQYDADNERIPPFTLQYQIGPKLYRATVDILVSGSDDNIDLSMEYEDAPPLRMVASAMPRNNL